MSLPGIRPAAKHPSVTAGLKCPPETCPTAYAMVSTDSPNANETPSSPMPTCGKAAARTALPQPPNTNHMVPKNSADNFCVKLYSFMVHPPPGGLLCGPEVGVAAALATVHPCCFGVRIPADADIGNCYF